MMKKPNLPDDANVNPAPTGQSITGEVDSEGYPNLKDYSILIAEDDIFSYEMIKHMLSSTKINILHAGTGCSAVEIVGNEKIDILFLDIRLPDLSGFEVLEQIRRFNKSISVVAQTANVLPSDRKKILKSGFIDCLTKPISQEDLIRVLTKYLNHTQKKCQCIESTND